MITVKYASFAEYLNTVASSCLNGSRLFRGQRDSNWVLENRWKRFKRDFLDQSVNSGEIRMDLRSRMIQEFRLVDLGLESMSEAETEALSQHTGLPTKLMDWSYSPYIGLFFGFDAAVVSPSSSLECAVFEIDLEKFIFASCFSIERDEALAKGVTAKDYLISKDRQPKYFP